METSEDTFDVGWVLIAIAALCVFGILIVLVAKKPRARSGQGRRKAVRKRVPKGDPRLDRAAPQSSPAPDDVSR